MRSLPDAEARRGVGLVRPGEAFGGHNLNTQAKKKNVEVGENFHFQIRSIWRFAVACVRALVGQKMYEIV